MNDASRKTEPRTCPVCGISYSADPGRLKHGRETTCSRKCSYDLRAKNKARIVEIACARCGRELNRSPSKIKGKHGATFCSRLCHYAGRSEGLTRRVVTRPYRISEAGRAAWRASRHKAVATRRLRDNYVKSAATIAKMSIATARAIARSQSQFYSSKIEHIVADQLQRLGVPFRRQRIVRDDRGRFAAVFDFWLTAVGVALEVNGTYWHADSRVYPAPKGDVQIRAVARYQRKLDLCARLGIRVVEVWELDLKKDPLQAVCNAHRQAVVG